ncbi:MAG: aldo/keto reductase [Chloroflexi bacterium]|nr:aldo/keto reductase [Chloroflexota bacterium]
MIYGAVPGLGDRVSRLVIGCGSFSPDRMDLVHDMLDPFVAAGGTTIDTAHVYGNGASERAVGSWLRERGRRDDVIIISKGAHPSLSDWVPRVSPGAITQDLGESLERLGVETIDLYLLHRDDPSVPVGPLVECLDEHAAAGRIRAFGVSNWTHQRIDEANAYAAAHGLRGFVASSPHLALAIAGETVMPGVVYVSGDAAALAWYRERQFPLFAWSSQARGFFSGRFSPDAPTNPSMVRMYYREDNWERLRRAREVAGQHRCTPTQVALAWVLHQQMNAFALIGPHTLPHLEDCLGALAVRLALEEVAWLNLETT